MIKTKTFSTIEVVNVVAYLTDTMTEEQAKELPTKFRWNLKKNMEKFAPVAKRFEEFRDELIKELQASYFNDEKSYEYLETKKDENGNPVLNEEGAEETVPMRKIKDEYFDEYEKAITELNNKLQEILAERNDYDINVVDMDTFVDNLPDDAKIDFDCLNILSFMDETTNVKDVKVTKEEG